MKTALDQDDYSPCPTAQLVQVRLGEMATAPDVDTSTLMLITDIILSVIADEAWQLQEQTDWHREHGTDGKSPDGSAVAGQPLQPEWSDVATWMMELRK